MDEESVYSGESEVGNKVIQDDTDEVESDAEDQHSPAVRYRSIQRKPNQS
jgi:hypothetical protein